MKIIRRDTRMKEYYPGFDFKKNALYIVHWWIQIKCTNASLKCERGVTNRFYFHLFFYE